ncbi:MAG: LamG-like jellyroll fold domain-containing protein [Candidatus Krumholzibacteriota bacterium]
MYPYLRRSAFLIFLFAVFLFSGSDAAGANHVLQFDGRDYLHAAGNETLDPADAITIEVWCMIPGQFWDLGNCPLIEKPFTSHSAPYYQYHLGINSRSQEFLFDLAINGTRHLLRSPLDVLPYGQWVHVAGTYDGTAMRLFVDGVEVSSRAASGQIHAYDRDVMIGRFGNFVDGIIGSIDEVRLWEVARTPEQIQQMMCSKLDGDEAGLVACWEFDEGSGQTAFDSSFNGNDATRGSTPDSDDFDPTWDQVQIPQCAPATIDVGIDVKPDSDENRVNCNPHANHVVPVALLTTAEFDATNVDHATVLFGPAETAEAHANLKGPVRHETDVDGDGDLDLLFHFRVPDSGIQCGDTKVSLTGETYDGQPISGADMIEAAWGGNKGLFGDQDIRITPNPFNPTTAISFSTDQTHQVRVLVYDIRGRLIANLADRQYAAGKHSVEWQGRDSSGRAVPSGEYFFRVDIGGKVETRKAILLR